MPAGSSVDIEPGAIVLGAIVTNGADTVRVCGATLLPHSAPAATAGRS